MKLINWLNEKLNYNLEMYILFTILTLFFAGTFRFLINDDSGYYIFLILSFFCMGIVTAYFIYNRNDDQAYGYKVRDKIRRLFERR